MNRVHPHGYYGAMSGQSHQVRTPRQDRSRETRERLLDAGQNLFRRRGFHGTNSKEIAAEAGVAIGSFYAYFRNKKELFMAVLNRYSERIFAALPDPATLAPLREDAREFIHDYIRRVVAAHDLPELHRELFVVMRGDPDFEALIERWEREAARRLEDTLRSASEHLRVRDLRTAAVLLQGTLEAMIQRLTVHRAAVDGERLVKELADMFHRYLFPDRPPG